MEANVLLIVMAIVLGGVIFGIMKLIAEAFTKFIKAVAKAPGKGFGKVVNYFKGRKAIKEDAKLDKALLLADKEARLNAAKQNPNYRNHPKVKVILDKRAYKESKKAK